MGLHSGRVIGEAGEARASPEFRGFTTHTATQLSQKLYQNQYLHFEKLVMAIGSQVKNDSR